ncbi:hypothetical protein GA0115246_102552, partial [Streptomyces sp. SolWspMP-sol7th]
MEELEREEPARLVHRRRGTAQRLLVRGLPGDPVPGTARAFGVHRGAPRDEQPRAAARTFRVERGERGTPSSSASRFRCIAPIDDPVRQAQAAERAGAEDVVEQDPSPRFR